MKTILTLMMIVVVVAPARAAVDLEKDQNRAVDELYRRASLRAEEADVAGLPKRIACDDGGDVLYRGVDTLSPTSDGRPGTVWKDRSAQEFLLCFDDGDQMDAVVFRKEDLAALQQGAARSIPARKIGGYWWADGDHFTLTTITCRLAGAR
ncbi:MAG: hypothetical protein NTX64_03720 [Elusimicrobia bacterium]|nr:hypothetical protein [Elusimicrobiota bacterium]